MMRPSALGRSQEVPSPARGRPPQPLAPPSRPSPQSRRNEGFLEDTRILAMAAAETERLISRAPRAARELLSVGYTWGHAIQ